MTLDQLTKGQCARVVCLREDCAIRERLQDLGMIPGRTVSVQLQSPLGDPTAYLICGSGIALRREDARSVEINTL